MKKLAIALMFLPFAAFAGKEERDFMSGSVTPAVNAAQAAYQKSCGCALKITLDPTLKTVEDMRKGKQISEHITEGAPEYCKDAESKKALCKMKTLKIVKGANATFVMAGATGTATTDGQSNPSWDQMTKTLDQ